MAVAECNRPVTMVVGARTRSIVTGLSPARTLGAALWFVAAAVGMTWPLAAGLARDIPWDLGDPLLNCWIIGWSAERLVRAMAGDVSALAGLWNANIFHPEPLTLAYSELLYAQVLQALPVYAATRNLILSYNLLFISTYALAALGAYLFVRELTGDWRAGLVAGLAFGFAPNRIAQGPHLQVLSSQWMPFALYGFRRYFETGRRRALAGATLAVVMQNWSCGYHLLFFALLLPAYLVWELHARGRLKDVVAWRGILMAGLATAIATVPVMWPYLALRQIHPGLRRDPSEIAFYSADVFSYLTASPHNRVWRGLQIMPRGEGELFPGSAILVLSAIAIGAALVAAAQRRRLRSPYSEDGSPRLARALGWFGLVTASVSATVLIWVIATGGRLPEDRLTVARREVVIQQQVDRATQLAISRGHAPGPFRGSLEGFPWDRLDPLHRDRSLKMVCARVFEHVDPEASDAIHRAASALQALGVRAQVEGVDRLRFSDGSVVDVLRNATGGAEAYDTKAAWIWLVTERPPPLVAPWPLAGVLVGLVIALGSVPTWRRRVVEGLRSPVAFFALATLAAFWLSLGPEPRTRGIAIAGFGLYTVLMDFVPGFDTIRVVARLAVLVYLSLSVLAGLGTAVLMRRYRRAAPVATAMLAAWVLADGFAAPINRNQGWTEEGLAMPSAREQPLRNAPEVYAVVRGLPAGAALIEFPFGVSPWEIRYTYRSTYHWRPIANGYSGWKPVAYRKLGALRRPLVDPDRAWRTLAASGVSHAVIHRDAYPPPPEPRAREDAALAGWLEQHGSRVVADTGDAVVYELPRR